MIAAEDGWATGLQVDEAELSRLRGKVEAEHDNKTGLIFHDRFGVRWELGLADYADAPAQSSGARAGRWLETVAAR